MSLYAHDRRCLTLSDEPWVSRRTPGHETAGPCVGSGVEMTRPRRLLLVLSNLGTGGAEWQVRHLARGLAQLGDDVTVVALGGPCLPSRR